MAVPVLKSKRPESPTVFAFPDRITTAPVVVDVLPPATITTAPPEAPRAVNEAPAANERREPWPLSEVPTTTLIGPAAAVPPFPERTSTLPELPEKVAPVDKVNAPELPDTEAGPVATRSAPDARAD